MVLTVLTLPGSGVEKVDVSGLVKLHHRSYDLLPFCNARNQKYAHFFQRIQTSGSETGLLLTLKAIAMMGFRLFGAS